MSFTLTRADVDSLLSAFMNNDLAPFFARLAPDAQWQIGASTEPGEGGSGVYTLETFMSKQLPRMAATFDMSTVKRELLSVYIVGHTAIAEHQMTCKLVNGGDYYNKSADFVEFSAETGEIKRIRAYFDTQLRADAEQPPTSA